MKRLKDMTISSSKLLQAVVGSVESLSEGKGGKKKGAGGFKLSGGAVNADDVAEFLQRLSSANYFENVELDVVSADDDLPTRVAGAYTRGGWEGLVAGLIAAM